MTVDEYDCVKRCLNLWGRGYTRDALVIYFGLNKDARRLVLHEVFFLTLEVPSEAIDEIETALLVAYAVGHDQNQRED
jgi:hypothetical protein